MNILTVTSLFPNSVEPKLGIFIETRMRQLKLRYPQANITVVAPVPWFPFTSDIFGSYGKHAQVPMFEHRKGFDVYHPRYLVLPKVGMNLTPKFMAITLKKCIKSLLESGVKIDVIDGHYYYPDGVAINKVATELGIPYTMTARGTDINLIAQDFPSARKQIQKVVENTDTNLAVCAALSDEIEKLSPSNRKAITARNGVDLDLFTYTSSHEQAKLRYDLELPVDKKVVISVGWLIERKGQHLIIESLKSCPDTFLVLAGSGPNRTKLESLVKRLGLGNRVKFCGALSQKELVDYFGASDISCLASDREGWANVLLESMACGTPVVATNIWGTPEIVASSEAGILVSRDVQNIANGISKLLDNLPSRQHTRKYAERFSWDETSQLLYKNMQSVIKKNCGTHELEGVTP